MSSSKASTSLLSFSLSLHAPNDAFNKRMRCSRIAAVVPTPLCHLVSNVHSREGRPSEGIFSDEEWDDYRGGSRVLTREVERVDPAMLSQGTPPLDDAPTKLPGLAVPNRLLPRGWWAHPGQHFSDAGGVVPCLDGVWGGTTPHQDSDEAEEKKRHKTRKEEDRTGQGPMDPGASGLRNTPRGCSSLSTVNLLSRQ